VSEAGKEQLYDALCHPDGSGAIETSRELATKEGIFIGTSGGEILSSALKIATESEPGTVSFPTQANDTSPPHSSKEYPGRRGANCEHPQHPSTPGLPKEIFPVAQEFVSD